LGTTLIFSNYL